MSTEPPADKETAPTETMSALLAWATAAQQAAQDAATERRRLRRRVFWWRLVALALIVVSIVSFLVSFDSSSGAPHVARFDVFGVIVDDRERDQLLSEIAEDDNAKALIVRIDSPGGTTVGGEALYESLRRVAEEKPVVAVMGEVAASAGYITAIAADHVIARGNTITASIGVILTAPNFAGTLETLGVEMIEVKSGDQKAEPSLYSPVDRDALDAEQELIADSFAWFVDLVRERRGLSQATISTVRDGRIVTGRRALELDLVDEIGGEREAVVWLEAERDVEADLPIIDRVIPPANDGFVSDWLATATEGLSLPSVIGDFGAGPRLISRTQ